MKEDIVKTSLQQFLLHGIRKMTVKEIVAPLGISTKTVYKYFENKEALLEECLMLHYRSIHHDLFTVTETFSNPVLLIFQMYVKGIELDFRINRTFYHDLNYYYPELQDKVINKEFKSDENELTKSFNDGIVKGYFRGDIAIGIMLEGFGALYQALTRTSVFEKFNVSPFELAQNTIAIYLRGICTQKGLQEIDNNPSLTSFNYKR